MSARRPLSIASMVRRWHTRGPMPRAPLGVSSRAPSGASIEAGDAIWIAPGEAKDPSALAALLPDPIEVGGAIVVFAPHAASNGFFARILGRSEIVPRAARGSALLSRGYASIGGGIDAASGLDLVWGVAHIPAATASSSGTST